jgi:transposase
MMTQADHSPLPDKERAAAAQRLASTAVRRVATHRPTRTQNSHFFARTQKAVRSAGEKMFVAKATNQSQERRTSRVSDLNPVALLEQTSSIVYGADIL